MTGAQTDVLVLGTVSSGKTVFLSILDLKLKDERTFPLGFAMKSDSHTAGIVDQALMKMRGGEWPGATLAGTSTPLSWDVYTGNRRVFGLSSMDISGESYMKAFGPDSKAQSAQESDARQAALKAKRIDDGFQEDVPGRNIQSPDAQDPAVEHLRAAADTAKVVCIFINCSLPPEKTWTNEDKRRNPGKFARFERLGNDFFNAVSVANQLLRARPDIAKKSVIVLTQTHLRRHDIDLAGGPAPYLEALDANYSSRSLSQVIREYDIPVVAVSAVNEEDSDGSGMNKFPELRTLDDIKSDGIFGFLLTVSGKVLSDDALSGPAYAYSERQRARSEYMRKPWRIVADKLRVAADYEGKSEIFLASCMEYLRGGANVGMTDAGRNSYVLEDMRSATRFETASDAKNAKRRAERDRIWDAVFRRAVAETVLSQPLEETEVLRRAREAVEDQGRGSVSDEALFGFDFPCPGCENREDWIEQNIEVYTEKFKKELQRVSDVWKKLSNRIASLDGHIGTSQYPFISKSLKADAEEFRKSFSAFKRIWLDGTGLSAEAEAERRRLEAKAAERKRLAGAKEKEAAGMLDEAEAVMRKLSSMKFDGYEISSKTVADLFACLDKLGKAEAVCKEWLQPADEYPFCDSFERRKNNILNGLPAVLEISGEGNVRFVDDSHYRISHCDSVNPRTNLTCVYLFFDGEKKAGENFTTLITVKTGGVEKKVLIKPADMKSGLNYRKIK